MEKKFWLMKTEPEVYSLDNLIKDKTTWWTGVRNYQARNFMMKDMQIGDEVLFYHSSTDPSGVAGLAVITQPARPDSTQFDPKSDYFEPRATKEKPLWYCVQVGKALPFKKFVSLQELRKPEELKDLMVLQKGSRLSIQPVALRHFDWIKKKGGL